MLGSVIGGFCWPRMPDAVASFEPLLDQRQVLVMPAEQADDHAVVVEGQRHLGGLRRGRPGARSRPTGSTTPGSPPQARR